MSTGTRLPQIGALVRSFHSKPKRVTPLWESHLLLATAHPVPAAGESGASARGGDTSSRESLQPSPLPVTTMLVVLLRK